MSQVYGFIQQSDSDIRVFSSPGQGTRIVMRFPRHFTSEISPSEMINSDSQHLFSGQETILVVDDEPTLQLLAEEILNFQGYTVLTADNAKQALLILDTESIDLLFSDVIMPGMNGYQLASEALKRQPNLKIQMVSGYNEQQISEHANEVLIRQQLNKPYKPNVLLSRIRQLLDENNV